MIFPLQRYYGSKYQSHLFPSQENSYSRYGLSTAGIFHLKDQGQPRRAVDKCRNGIVIAALRNRDSCMKFRLILGSVFVVNTLLVLLAISPGLDVDALERAETMTGTLNVPISVKETAGVGADGFPITVVIPLPYGKYQDVGRFRLVDSSGRTVPAQFDALNRWWGRDGSIRHVKIEFQPAVDPFTTSGSGITQYFLRDDGSGNAFTTDLKVSESSSAITVVTGPLKFTTRKSGFNILDQVWLDQNGNGSFEAGEQIIDSNMENGGVFVGRLPGDTQLDSARADLKVEVEEVGPMRAVIRAEAVTIYKDTEDHTHGWAVRIYAYAGKPYLKIDYQLQNSAKNVRFAWPLYFEQLNLDFSLNLGSNPEVLVGRGDGSVYQRARNNGLYLAQEFHDDFGIYDLGSGNQLVSGKVADGFFDVRDSTRGVAAFIRNFWQMWPNGFEVDGNNKLSIQLFPEWSSQWYEGQLSSTGLYWLEDMQHTYKETMLYFHDPEVPNEKLIQLAKTFQWHPVATLPTGWYQQTGATLDMDGMIPISEKLNLPDRRQPGYDPDAFTTDGYYGFNWINYWDDDSGARSSGTCDGGGVPYSLSAFIATENPQDYYQAERFALGEVNLRAQSMAQYEHEADYERLRLSENPYCGGRWRKMPYEYLGEEVLDAPYLSGSGGPVWAARDDQHGWLYHVEEAYYYTANPWIKDWFIFIAEFRRTKLERLDDSNDLSSRATGHALANVLQAFRVTGDVSILGRFHNHINQYLRAEQHPGYGHNRYGAYDEMDSDATHSVGYLARAIIGFMTEVRDENPQAYADAFQYLSGLMEWNLNNANFDYWINVTGGTVGVSSGTGTTLVDPQAWYYWHTGKKEYLDHLNQYIDHGINGGSQPYFTAAEWPGVVENDQEAFLGRFAQFVRENPRTDTTPPARITDLEAIISGSDVILQWTAPSDAVRYHIIWGGKPLSETTTQDSGLLNWWAANAIGPKLTPSPGARQQLSFTPSSTDSVYVAIFTFDAIDNMSAISNVVRAEEGSVVIADGDLNLDGVVNSLDVDICVNIILGFEQDVAIRSRADMNRDGRVDVLDLQKIVNLVGDK